MCEWAYEVFMVCEKAESLRGKIPPNTGPITVPVVTVAAYNP